MNLETEKNASALVADFLRYRAADGWTYETEVNVSGKRIDYVVTAPYPEGDITFGIEVKRRMHAETLTMTVVADYYEQAAFYAAELDMPVFLGPVISSRRASSSAWTGGRSTTAFAALNIFGGRSNVGTLVWFPHGWGMVLRGDFFWHQTQYPQVKGFNADRLAMAESYGSKRIRRSFFEDGEEIRF